MISTMIGSFALGIPIAISVALAALLALVLFTNVPIIVFAQQLFVALDKYPLVAIPLFIFAGNLMERGGISARLVEFAKAVLGRLKGGLAASCVLTCMIFAAVSGSSVATTFAVGAIMIPALVKNGYTKPFAASLQATSAELGVIIPPSIPLILYAVSAEVSIGDLFIAGVGPGLLIGSVLIVTVLIYSRCQGDRIEQNMEIQPLFKATKNAFTSLLMPVVILGGIYGGVFTPTEAASAAVAYALIVGVVVHRELPVSEIVPIATRSLMSTANILLIIAAAGVFSYLISRAGVPASIGRWITANFDSSIAFLLMVNLVLLLLGMFLETSASIIILTPILAPVAMAFGINPLHFGLIMIVNLALGMITPPFAVNLFAACQVAKIGIEEAMRPLLMFVCVMFLCLMLITFIPAISLTLVP
jgi:tripartite ATP-independent transporter DctM subunit